ncbi:GNAT family N-acetyltransferase [Aquabacterium sp. J223]|uniref:GNAT family N-acetyltransferase n=1 Tax=Aquabacterium sp. J223 TaxID=2898431 RepID=UPI0021ADA27E|nr:GNAT family N-acetyltransferase [Aquabacterium sp. J223]UUX94802.1 GNAT family N-acetyltransferase [Aquabacterium sp. J223]
MTAAIAPAAHPLDLAAGLTLEVLDSLDDMQALTPQWRRLLADHPGRNLFLTPAWNRAWWRTFGTGKTLRLLAMRDGGRLVGLAAFMLTRVRLRGLPVRVFSTFSNPHASRNDLVVAPGYDAVVAERLAAYLAQSRHEWDVAWLQQLPAEAPWMPAFLAAARRHGLLAQQAEGVGKCRMPLTTDWNGYVEQRGGHFRRNNGKTERRIERAGRVEYRHSLNPGPEDRDFEVFADVESRSWKEDADSAAHLGPAGWAFQKEFATAYDEGISCDNWIVELDGQPVTIVHTVGYDRVSYCFQTLYDERVRDLYLGRAAVTRHFQSVFDDGRYDVLDFNGNSPFCKSWCDTEQRFISLQLHHRRPYSLALWALKRLREAR